MGLILMKKQFFFVVYCVSIVCISYAQNTEDESGGSMLTSILQAITTTDDSPNCPGRCFNAIAALACTNILDEPGLCLSPGYRCCVTPDITTELSEQEDDYSMNISSTPVPETFSTWSDISETEDKTVEIKPPAKMSDESTKSKESHKQKRLCPGVCTMRRIGGLCKAVLDVEELCKPGYMCCVAKNIFDGIASPPKGFKIIDHSTDNSRKDNDSEGKEVHKQIKRQQAAVTESPITKTVINNVPTSKQGESDSHGNKEKCNGSCVSNIFSILCDEVDKSGNCPPTQTCCVVRKRNRPQKEPTSTPSSNLELTTVRRTTPEATTRTTTQRPTTRYTPPARTTPEYIPQIISSTPIPPPPCLGVCLTVSLASRCRTPSRLVVASGCANDEICCDNRRRRKNKPSRQPESSLVQPLKTLLSLFGDNSNSRPQRPQRRRPPPNQIPFTPTIATTTTTTTTTPMPTTTQFIEERDDREPCPGTCVPGILSFTCFGNAETTDAFICTNEKQICCAPKSAIKKFISTQDLQHLIPRNNTILTGQYPPPNFSHGSYISNPFQPPGFQPDYGQRPDYDYENLPMGEERYDLAHGMQQPPLSPAMPQFSEPTYEDANFNQHGNPQMQDEQYHYAYGTPDQNTFRQEPPIIQEEITHEPPSYPQSEENFYSEPSYVANEIASKTAPTQNTPALTEDYETPQSKYVCGIRGSSRGARVVGGQDAEPGDWCWQVALINSYNEYICGGALIGTQWVLTAAHCVTNIVRSGDAIYVRVGDHDLTTRYGSSGAQTIPVATTYIHHNHNSQTLDNDIALLKLSKNAELGKGVCLVCLPARGVSQVAGKRCTVTGYGYMGERGPIPLRIREADIPVVSDNDCVRQINVVTEKVFILPASSFCGGGENGHDACQGDGGGPLVCNVDGYYELSGLVSWGFGCGRADVPGVYVKVPSFIGWINQIISVNNIN